MPEPTVSLSEPEFGLVRDALAEISAPGEVGELLESRDEGEGVLTHLFECIRRSYRGWRWAVSVAHVDGEPSVLEAELIPGEDALLAPDWVPWADRLAEYRAAQAAVKADAGEDSDDDHSDDDELDDDLDGDHDDDDDDDDDDEFLPEDRHDADDIDGVDIDSLDQ